MGPLEGLRVIDCSAWIQGPCACLILGELGANVIKIEDRIHGDPIRGLGATLPVLSDSSSPFSNPNQAYFEYVNCNKRSITVDLSRDKGGEIVHRLVEKTDIFVHNFGKGVPEKLHLDYETLSAINPKLIYASASGWGERGPLADQPAMDQTIIAGAGMMYLAGEPDAPPQLIVGGLADTMGAIVLAQGILAAVVAKERLGIGQKVETSLLGSMISLEALPLAYRLLSGQENPRRNRRATSNPLANIYLCADKKWLMVYLLQGDRYWSRFCELIGIQELEKDPRFINLNARKENAEGLIRLLDRIFAGKTRDEWLKLFREAKLSASPVQAISDLVTDPQVLANNYIATLNHPIFGTLGFPGVPWNFNRTPAALQKEAPQFGQHTEEVLLEVGYTWEDIAQLREGEVI